MTHDPTQPPRRLPSGDAAAKAPTAAELAIEGRIFLLARPRGSWAVPAYLDTAISGFALCGAEGEQRIGELAGRGRLPVVVDVAHYEKRLASVEEPMVVPQTLFGLAGFFNEMSERSTVPALFTPSLYVEAAEPAALMAVRRVAREIDRTDVVVVVAIDVTWMREDKIDQVIAILKGIPHPIALILGGQYNPTDAYAAVMKNLRRVYREVGRVGPWRTDIITALDAMSNGALFAGVGASSGLRHLIPPGQKPKTTGRIKPSIFISELLHYFRADTLTGRWANVDALTCSCPVCDGRSLDRFDSDDTGVEVEARAHNSAAWAGLWAQMQALPTGTERRRWLAERIRRAYEAYDAENERIQQARAFKPSKTLERLARLTQSLAAPVTEGARTPAQ
jgi:hypothetical protein